MDCIEFNEKMSLYIDKQLNHIQKKEFEQHLNSCDRCKRDYNQMMQIIEFTREYDQEELPSNYKATLRAKLEDSKSEILKKKKSKWKRYTAIAASLLVIVTSISLLSTNFDTKDQALEESKFNTSANQKSEDGMYDEDLKSRGNDKVTKSNNPSNNKFDLNTNSISDDIQKKSNLEIKRKIIKNVRLSIEVDNFDETASNIQNYVGQNGGYIENDNQQIEPTSKGKIKYGNMIIRIPDFNLDKTVEFIKTLGQTNYFNSLADDITENYRDIDNEVKNLAIQEERLREILKKAEKVEDILKIENELRRIRTEINQKTGALNKWDDLVDFSTINVDIQQKQYSDEYIKPEKENMWSRAKKGFIQNINKTIVNLQNIIVVLISNLPTIFVVIILLIFIYLLYRKLRK